MKGAIFFFSTFLFSIAALSSKDNIVCYDEFLKHTKFNTRVRNKLRRICNWSLIQQKRLHISSTKRLLYPFGGADVLYPLVFFPNIDEIVIIGLEPAGRHLRKDDRSGYVSLNLRVLYEMGYFRTRQMEKISSVGGVITLMYYQLLAINAKDINVHVFDRGFHLRFCLNGMKKKVTYYSLNLKDAYIEQWSNILKKYKNFTLFLKSASYVLQQEKFEKISHFLIKRAKVIFQDDTGFRYSVLLKNGFKVSLYGCYSQPLHGDDNFHIYFQKNLMQAYLAQEEDVNVFDISYHEANWLIAIR